MNRIVFNVKMLKDPKYHLHYDYEAQSACVL
jgi:hypothetical protein